MLLRKEEGLVDEKYIFMVGAWKEGLLSVKLRKNMLLMVIADNYVLGKFK